MREGENRKKKNRKKKNRKKKKKKKTKTKRERERERERERRKKKSNRLFVSHMLLCFLEGNSEGKKKIRTSIPRLRVVEQFQPRQRRWTIERYVQYVWLHVVLVK